MAFVIRFEACDTNPLERDASVLISIITPAQLHHRVSVAERTAAEQAVFAAGCIVGRSCADTCPLCLDGLAEERNSCVGFNCLTHFPSTNQLHRCIIFTTLLKVPPH